MHYVDDAVIRYFPARLQTKHVQSGRLFGTEVRKGRIGHVICLQIELLEVRRELGHGAQALIREISEIFTFYTVEVQFKRVLILHAIVDGHGHEPGVEGRPQSLFGNFVAPADLQLN